MSKWPIRVLTTALLVAPSLALAAPKSLKELAQIIISVLNAGTTSLVFAGLVAYLITITFGMWRKEERGKMLKSDILWGILVLFVMVSIWGILNLLQETFFSGGQNPTRGPTTGSGGAFDTFGQRFEAP